MQRLVSPARNSALITAAALGLLVLLLAIALSTKPTGALSALVLFAALFFFPGYLLLSCFGALSNGLRVLISPVFGIVCMTTAYDLFAFTSFGNFFPYIAVMISVAGLAVFVLQVKRAPIASWCTRSACEIVAVGSAVVLSIAPVFWRSGRYSSGEFVFYGPAGQDQLFHITLLQRLLHHVPPDNFMVSGLRATVYHYFDDLTLAFVLRSQAALHLSAINLFDLFFRSYPILMYFLLGALAYRAGRQLLGSRIGGLLSVLLILGGGGLGWIFGVLHTISHISQLIPMRQALFFNWTSFEGVNSILPLIHRPAHYHGLLISLAALNVLFRPERSRRDWMLAGLFLGLMAGYNFTLAAILGISAVLAIVGLFLRGKRSEASELIWFALFIFLGSLPITAAMLLSGFHNMAPGFPFRGPNLEFPVGVWGSLLHRALPSALVPLASLILFPIVAYGLRLFGIGAMLRLDLSEVRLRNLAAVLAITFGISFILGVFFPYQGVGIAVIFLQPTLWILAMFALRPIQSWLQKGGWRPYAVWGILGLTWIQGLVAFNFSSKATFSQESAHVLEEIRALAAPDDVVAYLPDSLSEKSILSYKMDSTNFTIMAMTGLDGYFSTQPYTVASAIPGLTGRSPADVLAQAERLYAQRRDDIHSFLKGDISDAAYARLTKDQVRWIVVSGDALPEISSSATPWARTPDMTVYRLSP